MWLIFSPTFGHFLDDIFRCLGSSTSTEKMKMLSIDLRLSEGEFGPSFEVGKPRILVSASSPSHWNSLSWQNLSHHRHIQQISTSIKTRWQYYLTGKQGFINVILYKSYTVLMCCQGKWGCIDLSQHRHIQQISSSSTTMLCRQSYPLCHIELESPMSVWLACRELINFVIPAERRQSDILWAKNGVV